MGFLDQMGDAVSSLASKGKAKTKEIKDTTKLSSSIRNAQHEIEQSYMEIGKAYYEAHKDDDNPEFPQIGSITENLKKIEDLKEQRDEVKGIGHCPQCGAQIHTTDMFCPNCGAKVHESSESFESWNASEESKEDHDGEDQIRQPEKKADKPEFEHAEGEVVEEGKKIES